MNDRELTERITNMIDESAPPLSVEQVVARSHAGAVKASRQLNPRLVFAFSAALVILIAAVVVVSVAVRSGNSNLSPAGLGNGVSGYLSPLPETSLTPAGWAPFEFGDVQVSVPGYWVETQGEACLGPATTRGSTSEDPGCRLSSVTMKLSTKRAIPDARSSVVNGIPVVVGHSGSGVDTIYMERALGVDVEAKGSIAQQILATITFSPRSVILGSDVHGTPATWRGINYHGLTFDVPSNWTIAGSGPTAECFIVADTVILDSEQSSSSGVCEGSSRIGISGGGNPISQLAGVPGMSVSFSPTITPLTEDLFKEIIKSSQCLDRNGLKICIPPPAQQQFITLLATGSQTTMAYIFPSDGSTPVSFEIGLPESGVTALEILDSFRPAPTSLSTQPTKTVNTTPSQHPSTAVPTTVPASTGTTDQEPGETEAYTECSSGNYDSPAVRPTRVIITCGSMGLMDMAWSTWTPSRATGTGELWQSTCTSKCGLMSQVNEFPASITLYDVVQINDKPFFSMLKVDYSGAGPNGQKVANFRLPVSV
ncbi:MAG: hypothetical protein WAM97_09865 [Acidimicrobiales bacterium]